MTKKRIVAWLLAMVFVVGAFAGCEKRKPGDDESGSPSSTPSSIETEVDDKETVSQVIPKLTEQVAERLEENKDTVGWLQVPLTSLDEVVVWNSESNKYYERKDFYKNYDFNGVFYADRRSPFFKDKGYDGSADSLPVNTVIYGHALTDNPEKDTYKIKMGPLHDFRDPTFASEVPYVFYSTETENFAFEVFAVFVANADNSAIPYNRPDLPAEEFIKIVEDEVLPRSLYNYDVKLNPEDKFITLSTCIYRLPGHEDEPEMPYPNNYRYAIMGRLVSPDEPLKLTSGLKVNEDMLVDPAGIMDSAKK